METIDPDVPDFRRPFLDRTQRSTLSLRLSGMVKEDCEEISFERRATGTSVPSLEGTVTVCVEYAVSITI